MLRLSIALKKQKREIEKLKFAPIKVYSGFNKERLIIFDIDPIIYDYEEEAEDTTQKLIDSGQYKSVISFDGEHTPDLEFIGNFSGRKIGKYRHETKKI